MDTQDLQVIAQLLKRISLSGEEALAFVQLQQRIAQAIEKQTTPEANEEVVEK